MCTFPFGCPRKFGSHQGSWVLSWSAFDFIRYCEHGCHVSFHSLRRHTLGLGGLWDPVKVGALHFHGNGQLDPLCRKQFILNFHGSCSQGKGATSSPSSLSDQINNVRFRMLALPGLQKMCLLRMSFPFLVSLSQSYRSYLLPKCVVSEASWWFWSG